MLVRPGMTTPFLNQVKVSGPEPPTEVANVAVSPAQRVRDCNAVAVKGCKRLMTENAQVVMLPAASMAVHCTRLVPDGKLVPEGGMQVTTGLRQLS